MEFSAGYEGSSVTNPSPPCAVVSLPDIELEGQVSCARRRLVVIALGFSESVAKAIVKKWHALGRDAVLVVVDPDPEVCRSGLGDLAALQMLQKTAEQVGGRIHQQQGLRVGVIVTDETTTVYSPSPRLVEAGGQPGERLNAIRFDTPILDDAATIESDLRSIDLHPEPMKHADVQNTAQDLAYLRRIRPHNIGIGRLSNQIRSTNTVGDLLSFPLITICVFGCRAWQLSDALPGPTSS